MILPPNAIFIGDLLAPRTLRVEQGARYETHKISVFALVQMPGLPAPWAGHVLSSPNSMGERKSAQFDPPVGTGIGNVGAFVLAKHAA